MRRNRRRRLCARNRDWTRRASSVLRARSEGVLAGAGPRTVGSSENMYVHPESSIADDMLTRGLPRQQLLLGLHAQVRSSRSSFSESQKPHAWVLQLQPRLAARLDRVSPKAGVPDLGQLSHCSRGTTLLALGSRTLPTIQP